MHFVQELELISYTIPITETTSQLREILLNDDVILDVKKKIKNTKNYSIQEVIVALSEIKETKLKINFK